MPPGTDWTDPWVVDVEWSDRSKHDDGTYITDWVHWVLDPVKARGDSFVLLDLPDDTAATLLALQLTLQIQARGGLVMGVELTL